MRRNIKQIVLRNVKIFPIYLFCYLISIWLFVWSGTYADIYDKICLQIFQQTGWNVTVTLWTIIAIVINLIIMSSYVFEFQKNKSLSVIFYVLICIILGNIWFWVSVVPGIVVYFGSGGIMS